MRRIPRSTLVAAVAAVGLVATCAAPPDAAAPSLPPATGTVPAGTTPAGRVVVFTRTAGFRHDGIDRARVVLSDALGRRGYEVTATEDPAAFSDAGLRDVEAVAFVQTTGDVLGPEQEAALERFVRTGGGWAGVHAAADTEHGWPFYEQLVGARFARHPTPQPATVRVEDAGHPSTAALAPPAPAGIFTRTDEWYDVAPDPRGRVHVLATVDEATYEGGGMGADHPIVWCGRVDTGSTWYTGLGHAASAWEDPVYVAHVAEGIDAVARGLPCGGTDR